VATVAATMTEYVAVRDKGYRHLDAWHAEHETCPHFPDDAETQQVPKEQAERWGLHACPHCEGEVEVESYDNSYQQYIKEKAERRAADD